jgi:hypothetical protein
MLNGKKEQENRVSFPVFPVIRPFSIPLEHWKGGHVCSRHGHHFANHAMAMHDKILIMTFMRGMAGMTFMARAILSTILVGTAGCAALAGLEKKDLRDSDTQTDQDLPDSPDPSIHEMDTSEIEELPEGYGHYKTIIISNSHDELSDYDVLVEIDTASLISAGEMKPSCDDMRFLDDDLVTMLTYWLEQGCDTARTQIWVRVPFIPSASTKTIYMIHGNEAAGNASAPYAGSFIVMFSMPCPEGWSAFPALNEDHRFPRGSTAFGGIGGSASHEHGYSTQTGAASNLGACEQGGSATGLCPDHTHAISGELTGDILPSYVDTVFCSSLAPAPLLPTSAMMWAHAVPEGWTSAGLINNNGAFPRGSETYGGMGGSASHDHAFNGITGEAPPSSSCGARDQSLTIEWSSNCPHIHTYDGTTEESGNLPPYEDIAAVLPEAPSPFVQTMVAATTSDSPPPLGWDSYSSLNDNHRFPRGCTACGGTGGTDVHGHSYEGDTDPDVNTNKSNQSCGWAHWGHTHAFEFTATDANHVPPYLDVVFVQRKTVLVDVTVMD